ncbi:MAG: regulatory protein RecX [Gammaproteobacteria bacterium]
MSEDRKQIRQIAIAALARREHSRVELHRKLTSKGFHIDTVESELDRLASERLQDDSRFAEAYIRYRAGHGYGPVKIGIELSQRGVGDALSTHVMEQLEVDWFENSQLAWEKKFGVRATDYKERAKQARFLQHRGFTGEQISVLLNQEH